MTKNTASECSARGSSLKGKDQFSWPPPTLLNLPLQLVFPVFGQMFFDRESRSPDLIWCVLETKQGNIRLWKLNVGGLQIFPFPPLDGIVISLEQCNTNTNLKRAALERSLEFFFMEKIMAIYQLFIVWISMECSKIDFFVQQNQGFCGKLI